MNMENPNENNPKVRIRSFYEVLWLLCEQEGFVDLFQQEGYLAKSRDTYYWTPKAMKEFSCVVNTEKPLSNDEPTYLKTPEATDFPKEVLNLSDTFKKAKSSVKTNIPEDYNENKLETFLNLFSKQNIGIAGKGGSKITVAKKLIKFFQEYPDYDMDLIIKATELYIETMKKQGSIRFIRECVYFISKRIDGVDVSDLAKWCEEYKSGGQTYTSHNIL